MAKASRSGQGIKALAASKAVENSRLGIANPVVEVRQMSEKAGGIRPLNKLADVLRCRGR
jgi:hypothetical protein